MLRGRATLLASRNLSAEFRAATSSRTGLPGVRIGRARLRRAVTEGVRPRMTPITQMRTNNYLFFIRAIRVIRGSTTDARFGGLALPVCQQSVSSDPTFPNRRMFIYFDLGNVLAMFDRERAVRQVAAVAGIAPDAAPHGAIRSPSESSLPARRNFQSRVLHGILPHDRRPPITTLCATRPPTSSSSIVR